jgi:hypothetical protein
MFELLYSNLLPKSIDAIAEYAERFRDYNYSKMYSVMFNDEQSV